MMCVETFADVMAADENVALRINAMAAERREAIGQRP